jgi:hypothetical protein
MATTAPTEMGRSWPSAVRPLVIEVLTRPLPVGKFLIVSAFLVSAVAAYCYLYCLVAYTPLHGQVMPLHWSFIWAFSAVLPWVICFELAKRARFLPTRLQIAAIIGSFVLAALLSVPLGLGFAKLLGGSEPVNWPMEIAHLLPRAAVTAALIGMSRIIPPVHEERGDAVSSNDLRPLLEAAPEIEWIKAAGNYVEVRRNGRTLLHRVTMQSLEASLDPSRFVRIHRQVIVNTDFVDCHLGSGAAAALRLKDGTIFKIGARYGRNAVASSPISSLRH